MKKYLFLALGMILALASCTTKPTKTVDNLKAAIKGELTATAKYAAFAQKATEEKHDAVAKLFEAASKAESIHAANHTKVLEGLGEKMDEVKPEFEVKTTAENLKAAIEGETYEDTQMYPKFIEEAKKENVDKAVKSFTWARDTEKKHADFYKKALAALEGNTENTLPTAYLVCPVCGNTYDAAAVDAKCAFCGTPKEKFEKI